MRCVFDTNVLVSALLLPGSKPRQALDLATRQGKLLISFATLAELSEVLTRKRFRRYVDEEGVRSFLAALVREAQFVEVNVAIHDCRDAKDNKFLELAVCGEASHLITGDSDLLELHPFRGCEVVTPHKFLDSLARASGVRSH